MGLNWEQVLTMMACAPSAGLNQQSHWDCMAGFVLFAAEAFRRSPRRAHARDLDLGLKSRWTEHYRVLALHAEINMKPVVARNNF